MALNPNIPLQLAQVENPLMGLSRGIEAGSQMVARRQALDLQRQEAQQRQQAAQTQVAQQRRKLEREDIALLGGAVDSIKDYSLDPEERFEFTQRLIDRYDFQLPEGFIDGPEDMTDETLNAFQQLARQEAGEMTDFQRESLRLRERQLGLEEQRQAAGQQKLSAGLEKALIEAQDLTVDAARKASGYSQLADNFATRPRNEGGLVLSWGEFLKRQFGTQDELSEWRREFNKVRLSEGLRFLPPGPATDRDIQEAFKGVPPENANPERVEMFLRGAAKLARWEAGYNQFKADFISGKSTAKGLNREWRRRIKIPNKDREDSVGEIYATAQNRGISPEQVADLLGVREQLGILSE